MSRVWRKQCPRNVRVNQQNALSASFLYLIRQAGPSAYVIKDDHTKQQVTVRLGDSHSCTCREYELLRDVCLHIAWVLLKKLKLKCSDPLSFQLGLVPRELNQVLQPKGRDSSPLKNILRNTNLLLGKCSVGRRQVQRGDSCPICLEDYWVKHTPVAYCKYSCGNPVHVKCMVILAQHQVKDTEGMSDFSENSKEYIQCPLCRGDFMTLEELTSAASSQKSSLPNNKKPDKLKPLALHASTKCRLCLASPIHGNLYRCLVCPQVFFCAHCLLKGTFTDLHNGHGFMVKKAPGEKWKEVKMDVPEETLKVPKKTTLNQGIRRKNTEAVDHLTTEEENLRAKGKMALESGSLYKVPTFEQMVEASILLQENLLFSKSKNLTSNIRKVLKRQADVKLPPPEVRVHRAELYERGLDVKPPPPVIAPCSTGCNPARRRTSVFSKGKRAKEEPGGGGTKKKGPRVSPPVRRAAAPNKAQEEPRLPPILTPANVQQSNSESNSTEFYSPRSYNETNKISVNLDGRTLGSQVQPLMTVLMHPRPDGKTERKLEDSEDEGIDDLITGVVNSDTDEEERGGTGGSGRSTLEMKVAQFEAPQEAEVTRGLRARSWTQLSAKRWSGPRSSASF